MTLRTELREWTLAAYSVGYCVAFQAAPSEQVPFATVVRCTWRRNGWNSAGEYREMTVVDEMLERIPLASTYLARELGTPLLGRELLDIIERAAGDLDDSRRLGSTGVEFVGGPMDGTVATLAVDAQGFPPEHWVLPVPVPLADMAFMAEESFPTATLPTARYIRGSNDQTRGVWRYHFAEGRMR
jgi:hypothetical protein